MQQSAKLDRSHHAGQSDACSVIECTAGSTKSYGKYALRAGRPSAVVDAGSGTGSGPVAYSIQERNIKEFDQP